MPNRAGNSHIFWTAESEQIIFLDKLTRILLPARNYPARILPTGGELRKAKVISQRKGSDVTNQQGLRKPGAGLAKWHSLLAGIADEKLI